MAQISKGLTLQQTQLIAYAIHKTQQDGVSSFSKREAENQMGKKMMTRDLKRDAAALMDIRISLTLKDDPDAFSFINFFQRISYEKGTVSFRWSDDIVPHIIDLKSKYITNDLRITSKFSSAFSWTLYEFLKANYGRWYTELSKNEMLNLFGVKDVKTYVKRTGSFKQKVLDVAIGEVNEHTEYEVCYEDIRSGRSIVGFRLSWSVGMEIRKPTAKQIKESDRRLHHIINLSSGIFVDAMTNLSMDDLVKARGARQRAEEIHERITSGEVDYDDVSRILDRYIVPMHDLLMIAEKGKMDVNKDRQGYDWINDDPPLYNWLDNKERN